MLIVLANSVLNYSVKNNIHPYIQYYSHVVFNIFFLNWYVHTLIVGDNFGNEHTEQNSYYRYSIFAIINIQYKGLVT